MLISKELASAINDEIGRELFASHQYISIACYLDDHALKIVAKLFLKQAEEERAHAMKFVDYLTDVDAKVLIPAIDAPRAEFNSVEEAFQLALDWELKVTGYINDLMRLAIDMNDYMAQDFLRWFVTEQREEVHTMDNLLKVCQQAGERNIIMVEAYLAHQ